MVIAFPIYMAWVASTHTAQAMAQWPIPLLPGDQMFENYAAALTGSENSGTRGLSVYRMLLVSLISALTIAFGKIIISLISAFALVYFKFPFRGLVFWCIFITLMLPVEVRIVPTFKVIADLGMLNSYAGLTIPLIASATATFLFRQFFKSVPNELVEAAKVDGAGPMRFFLTSSSHFRRRVSQHCSSYSLSMDGTNISGLCLLAQERTCIQSLLVFGE